MTPEILHILTMADASVLTLVYVKTLVDLNWLFEAVQLSGAANALRPAQFSVYASPILFTL